MAFDPENLGSIDTLEDAIADGAIDSIATAKAYFDAELASKGRKGVLAALGEALLGLPDEDPSGPDLSDDLAETETKWAAAVAEAGELEAKLAASEGANAALNAQVNLLKDALAKAPKEPPPLPPPSGVVVGQVTSKSGVLVICDAYHIDRYWTKRASGYGVDVKGEQAQTIVNRESNFKHQVLSDGTIRVFTHNLQQGTFLVHSLEAYVNQKEWDVSIELRPLGTSFVHALDAARGTGGLGQVATLQGVGLHVPPGSVVAIRDDGAGGFKF